MRAYHGEQSIKDHYLVRVRQHRLLDELIHGRYWEQGKGCAVGCTIHSSNHATYEKALGIPRILAWLEDRIFESLPSPYDLQWPEAFLEAIPVGANLQLVWPQFVLSLLNDPVHGVLQYVQPPIHSKQRAAIEDVIVLYQQWIDTQKCPTVAAATGVDAAYDVYATTDSAYAAAGSAYASAASAAAAAAYAADAAADSVAAYAAVAAVSTYAAIAATRRGEIIWQSELLLTLLSEAPVS